MSLIPALSNQNIILSIVFNLVYTFSYRHAVASVPNGWQLLASSMLTFGGVSMGLSYISGIVLLFIEGEASLFVRYFVPIGRMALTKYLLQSIICAFLFHAYGLGLYGRVEVWQGILLTMVIFMLQMAYSRVWLNHSFEWLWRSLTYFKIQQMMKIQAM